MLHGVRMTCNIKGMFDWSGCNSRWRNRRKCIISGEKAMRKRGKRLEVPAHPLSHFIATANESSTVFFS